MEFRQGKTKGTLANKQALQRLQSLNQVQMSVIQKITTLSDLISFNLTSLQIASINIIRSFSKEKIWLKKFRLKEIVSILIKRILFFFKNWSLRYPPIGIITKKWSENWRRLCFKTKQPFKHNNAGIADNYLRTKRPNKGTQNLKRLSDSI